MEQRLTGAKGEKFSWNNTFTRFLLIGVLNTLVGLSTIFILLHVFHLGYWLSTCLGNVVGGVVSYVLNRTFTFRSNAGYARSFWRFAVVVVVCYFFSYWVASLFGSMLSTISLLPLSGTMIDNITVLVGSGLYTITNYVGHKFFTFRVTERSAQ